jgi:hypothetical protein
MTTTTLKLLLLGLASGFAATIACSSSSGGSGVVSCKNPTVAESACSACEAESCAAENSAVIAACSSYVSCYQGCDCSDDACVLACAEGSTASCKSAAAMAGASCTACKSVCEPTVTITIPTVSTSPSGDTFAGGFVVGGACSGDVYVAGAEGYLFCDDGVWAYTSTDPAADGYTMITGAGDDGGFDAGDDSGSDDSGADAGDDSGSDDSGFDAGDDSGSDAGDDSGSDDSGADAGTGDAATDAS